MLNRSKLTRVIMGLVLATALALGGVLPFNTADVAAAGFGSISGSITEAGTGDPIYPAKIVVENAATGEFVGEFNNFADGSFILVFEEGAYLLRAEAAGYAAEWYDNSYSREEATQVPVVASQTEENVNFGLAVGGTISGTVRLQQQGWEETRDQITVKAKPADGSAYGFRACTEGDGTYTMEGVPYGDYVVKASGRGKCTTDTNLERWMTQWYDGQDSFETADVVTVGVIPSTNIDFVLQEGGTIAGSVRDQNGQPFGVATAFVEDWDTGRRVAETETNENGDFDIQGLPGGDYLVSATADGRELKYFQNVYSREDAEVTHIEPGWWEHRWFNLGPGGSFSGTVSNADGSAAIAGAKVEAFDSTDGRHIRGIKVEDDGTYTFDGLPQGFFKAWASAPGYVREYYGGVDNVGVADFEDASIVAVVAGQNTPNVNFKLDVGGTITGTVTDVSTGQPVANINVGVADTTSEDGVPYLSFKDVTDQDGNYTIDGLPFGGYTVWATGEWGPNARYMEKWYNDRPTWETADTVTVDAGTPIASGKDFALEKGGAIRGLLTREEDGQPVTDQPWVRVWEDTTEGFKYVADGDVREDGSYIVEGLPTGDYLVVAGAWERARKLYNNVYTLQDSAAVPVTAPNDTRNINFSLEEGGHLDGEVWNWQGQRLENFRVTAIRDDGLSIVTRTRRDESGNVRYEVWLPYGNYKVVARGGDNYPEDPWYVTQWYSNQWSEEEAQTLEITEQSRWWYAGFNLPRGGAISGQVTDVAGNPLEGVDIDVDRYYDWQPFGHIQTDAQGSYRLLVWPDEDLRVMASTPGYVSEFYQETTDPWEAEVLRLSGGTERSDIDFTLVPGGVISGTIYKEDGETPLPRAEVVAVSVSDPEDALGTSSDDDGTYGISVPFGDYKVRAQGGRKEEGGDPRYAMQWYSGTSNWDEADVVTISETTTSQPGIDFILEPGGSISGTVEDEWGNTVWDAYIIVRDAATGMFVGDARIEWQDQNEEYGYAAFGLASGHYQVTAWANGRSRVFYDNRSGWDEADTVEVSAPDDSGEVSFQLIWANGRISGDVLYQGAVTNPENHEVHVLAVDERMMEYQGRAEEPMGYQIGMQGPGHYQFDNIGEGSYFIFAFLDADDSGDFLPTPGDPYGFYEDLNLVEITKTNEDPPGSGNWTWSWKAGADIEITDGAKGYVVGAVEMELREPSGATITIDGATTTSDEQGFYAVTTTPGTYEVTVSMEGYLPARMSGVEVEEILKAEPVMMPTAKLTIGDTNGDEAIDAKDAALIAANLNTSPVADERADVNKDGTADIFDLVLIGKRFGATESEWPREILEALNR